MLFKLKVEQNSTYTRKYIGGGGGSKVQAFMIDLVIYLTQIAMPVHLL